MNKPYIELEPTAQDALFQEAAKTIFEASTRELRLPLKFVEGINSAASEGRLLVASFDDDVNQTIAGTRVEGALAGDDGATPHVDIGVNDATGSKMSYYLRYWADVRATSCRGETQVLSGSMTLNQAIAPSEAAQLPVSVTGGGNYGTEPGSQLVLVRLYGPSGGAIDHIRMDGRSLDRDADSIQLNGRPVATLVVLLSNRGDVVINWTMQTGQGQTGDVELGMTASIVPGNNDAAFRSAC